MSNQAGILILGQILIPSIKHGTKPLNKITYQCSKCQCCSALYVDQTARHLHTRVSDHLGVSSLTGKKRATSAPSSILAHLSVTGHTASLDEFKVLSTYTSPSELQVREGLLIFIIKPSELQSQLHSSVFVLDLLLFNSAFYTACNLTLSFIYIYLLFCNISHCDDVARCDETLV